MSRAFGVRRGSSDQHIVPSRTAPSSSRGVPLTTGQRRQRTLEPILSAEAPRLPSDVLEALRQQFPTAYAALRQLDELVQQQQQRCHAKEAELLRCISVGQELLQQIDALKQRCTELAAEKEAAGHAPSLPTVVQSTAIAAATREKEEIATRYQSELREALQTTRAAQLRREEAEDALALTRAETQQVRTELQQCQLQLAVLKQRQHSDGTRDAVLSSQRMAELCQVADARQCEMALEASAESERLRRTCARLEEELAEERQSAQSALARRDSQAAAAAVAQQRLEEQLHSIRREHQEMKEELRCKEAELATLQAVYLHHCESEGANESNRCLTNQQQGAVASTASLAAIQQREANAAPLVRHLQEENERLRGNLKAMASREQQEAGLTYAAKMELLQQIRSLEAQTHALRNETVPAFQAELSSAAGKVSVAESAMEQLQGGVAAKEARVGQEKQEWCRLVEELRVELNRHRALLTNAVEEKESAEAALQALRRQTEDREGYLNAYTAQQMDLAAMKEALHAELQRRESGLDRRLKAAAALHAEERQQLEEQLRSAAEAIAVLKDAQGTAEAAAKEARRTAAAAEQREHEISEKCLLRAEMMQSTTTELQQQVRRGEDHIRLLSEQLEQSRGDTALQKLQLDGCKQEVLRLQAEMAAGREEEAARYKDHLNEWKRQYGRNTREKEQLLLSKDAGMQQLQQECQTAQQKCMAAEQQAQQALAQRNELLSSHASAAAALASAKGRCQALEEELVHASEERRSAQEAAQRSAQRCAQLEAQQCQQRDSDSVDAERREMEAALLHCRRELEVADQRRKAAERFLMQGISTSSPASGTAADIGNSSGAWDDPSWAALVDCLELQCVELGGKTATFSPALALLPTLSVQSGDTESNELHQCAEAALALVRVLQASIEHVGTHYQHRWVRAKHAILHSYQVETAQEAGGQSLPTLPPLSTLSGALVVPFAEQVRAIEQVVERWVSSLQGVKALLSKTTSDAEEKCRLVAESYSEKLNETRSAIKSYEEEMRRLQILLESVQQGKSAVEVQLHAAETQLDKLRMELTERDATIGDLRHRNAMLVNEKDAEMLELTARLQEVHQQREKQQKGYNAEVLQLQQRLASMEVEHRSTLLSMKRECENEVKAVEQKLADAHQSTIAKEKTMSAEAARLSAEREKLSAALLKLRGEVGTLSSQLQHRTSDAEAQLKERDNSIKMLESEVEALKRYHHQQQSDDAISGAYQHQSLKTKIAALEAQLRACEEEQALCDATAVADRAELAALRKANAALESRLSDVESEREPLRQHLHSLLSFSSDR